MIKRLITDWKWIINPPENYGWYHLMWLAIMIAATILSCVFLAKKHNKKTDDKFIFSIGFMLIVIEIYKQIFYTLDAGRYQWYSFPFQFCSVPMFVAFIAPLIKKESIKEAMYKFLATFGLIAGISVMLYPDSTLNTPYITILVHTMLWHSSMVVMGVYLIVARGYGKNIFKDLLPALYIFLIIVAIAVVTNLIAYHTYFNPELGLDPYENSFNLLFLSPYYDSPLPILSDIKELANGQLNFMYIVFLLCYIVAFTLGVLLVLSFVYLIRYLHEVKHVKNRKSSKNI